MLCYAMLYCIVLCPCMTFKHEYQQDIPHPRAYLHNKHDRIAVFICIYQHNREQVRRDYAECAEMHAS